MSNYTIQVAWSSKDSLLDSDPAKVISGDDFNTEFTAVQSAVNTKAEIAGSATQPFSATTAAAGTDTTQVATTEFTQAAVTAGINASSLSTKAPLASPAFTGVPTAPTAATSTNTTQVATTAFTQAAITSSIGSSNLSTRAPIDSPSFTGVPTAATASAGTNNTQLATTAFTTTAINAIPDSGVGSVNVNGTSVIGKVIYIDTDAPSGGNNGDIWFEY